MHSIAKKNHHFSNSSFHFLKLYFGKCVKIWGLLCINLNEKVVNVGFYVPVIRLLSAPQRALVVSEPSSNGQKKSLKSDTAVEKWIFSQPSAIQITLLNIQCHVRGFRFGIAEWQNIDHSTVRKYYSVRVRLSSESIFFYIQIWKWENFQIWNKNGEKIKKNARKTDARSLKCCNSRWHGIF